MVGSVHRQKSEAIPLNLGKEGGRPPGIGEMVRTKVGGKLPMLIKPDPNGKWWNLGGLKKEKNHAQ